MALVKFERVVSFSSEDKAYPASNLIQAGSYKKWRTNKPGENVAFVVLKLAQDTIVTGIDIGNEGSAFVEVRASKDGKEFTEFVPNSSMMSPMEAKTDEERNRVRMFTKFEPVMAGESILYLKVICKQPYNRIKAFGLNFIKVTGRSARTADMDEPMSIENDPVIPSEASGGYEMESDEDDTPSTSRDPTESKKSPPKKATMDPKMILKDVRFAISGFQNPLRSQLRSRGISLGARYEPDWTPRCHFLICAFPNTPKWSEVAKNGGRAVTKDWLEECHKQQKKVPWRDFKCGKYRDKVLDNLDSEAEESNDEDDEYIPESAESADEDIQVSPIKQQRKESSEKNSVPKWSGGELREFFSRKTFFLDHKTIEDPEEIRTLQRYVFGHAGDFTLRQEEADFIVTGNSCFEGDALKLVSPSWVVLCHQENRLIDKLY